MFGLSERIIPLSS